VDYSFFGGVEPAGAAESSYTFTYLLKHLQYLFTYLLTCVTAYKYKTITYRGRCYDESFPQISFVFVPKLSRKTAAKLMNEMLRDPLIK